VLWSGTLTLYQRLRTAEPEEERVAATEQGFNEELKLAALPRKIDPEGRTYVEVDDMLFWVREGAGAIAHTRNINNGPPGIRKSRSAHSEICAFLGNFTPQFP
jgi:hypothetical protein